MFARLSERHLIDVLLRLLWSRQWRTLHDNTCLLIVHHCWWMLRHSDTLLRQLCWCCIMSLFLRFFPSLFLLLGWFTGRTAEPKGARCCGKCCTLGTRIVGGPAMPMPFYKEPFVIAHTKNHRKRSKKQKYNAFVFDFKHKSRLVRFVL